MDSSLQSSTEALRYAAFTKDDQGGNPAGIVLQASHLDEKQMLAIAAGIGYSETVFVTGRPAPGTYQVRYFSPLAEVPFCGHATIALSAALAEHEASDSLRLLTGAGEIVVAIERDAAGKTLATLTSVPTHTHAASDEEVSSALRALRWTADDLDPHYPVHVAYGGASHLIVAVKDRQTLASLDYDYTALEAFMAEQGWTTLQIFWAETPQLVHARNPFPPGGVREDPATGAAAAALGGYLRSLGLIEVPGTLTILQGEDNGTPSLLRVHLAAGVATVQVSGTASRIGFTG